MFQCCPAGAIKPKVVLTKAGFQLNDASLTTYLILELTDMDWKLELAIFFETDPANY